MVNQIKLGDIAVDVLLKDIKNVHLSIHPPTGRVRISAPRRMTLDLLRVFAISKLDWIRQQQKKIRAQERETPREYLERESHYLWGKRYLLRVVEDAGRQAIDLKHRTIILRVGPGATAETKKTAVARWYREQIRASVPEVVAKWESILGVQVKGIFVQRMKTKWGSCNPSRGTIRLNTELAKKPVESLEYIVVHEMVHFLEPTHNARFVQLMDRAMPHWRMRRERLNQLPVCHEEWAY
jgi:predicted metal-dependent hydrolase